jgi:hypothetical protein
VEQQCDATTVKCILFIMRCNIVGANQCDATTLLLGDLICKHYGSGFLFGLMKLFYNELGQELQSVSFGRITVLFYLIF